MTVLVESSVKAFPAGADLSAKKNFIVKFSSGQVVLAAAATDHFIGVVDQKPAATTGSPVAVRLRSAEGTLKVKAGGTVNPGDFVTSDGSGQAVATTTNKDQLLGMFVGLAAAASGDIIEVMPANGTLSAT